MRQAQNRIDRLYQLVGHFSHDPIWTALTLLFVRCSFDGTAWTELTAAADDDLAGRIDERLGQICSLFPHQFDDGRMLERVRELNGSKSLRPLLDQTAVCVDALASEPSAADDVIGTAYMLLLSKKHAQARGEFYTPTALALMMARMMAPAPGQRVIDPACGSGRLLLAALEACRERHGDEGAASVQLYGIELNGEMAQVARMNLVLAGAGNQTLIATADALAGPAFLTRDGEPATFDVVIANPPFGR